MLLGGNTPPSNSHTHTCAPAGQLALAALRSALRKYGIRPTLYMQRVVQQVR